MEEYKGLPPDFLAVWQPIEMAPKDGTAVLLFDPTVRFHDNAFDDDNERYGRIVVGRWKQFPNGYGDWKGYYTGTPAAEEPTHWMPLPKPPKS